MRKDQLGGGGARTIEASVVRQTFREVVDDVTSAGRRVVITRHGRPVAALVSIRDLEQLRERDAATDQRMRERRPARGTAMSFEEFAANDPANVAGQVAEHMSVEQAADEIAGHFMADFLGPQVTEQARTLIMTMMEQHVGEATTVPFEELQRLRSLILEKLHKLAVQVPA